MPIHDDEDSNFNKFTPNSIVNDTPAAGDDVKMSNERFKQMTLQRRKELERDILKPNFIRKKRSLNHQKKLKQMKGENFVDIIQQANANYLQELNKYNAEFKQLGSNYLG